MTAAERPDLVVHAHRALVGGALRPAVVEVTAGVVSRVLDAPDPWSSPSSGVPVVALADDEVLLPGLVDTHVHVNEPGRTHWEGYATATRAALVGGVTTIVDMPLNSLPPTLDAAALATKKAAAQGQVAVDVGFWGGAVPGNLADLDGLLDAGVFGVKCFLQDSGVPEFPPVTAEQLVAAMRVLAARDGLMLVHAEDPGVLAASPAPQGRSYAAFVASRPPDAEARAVQTVADAVRRTGGRAHVVHVSSAAGAEVIRRARADGLPLTGETCPHYLTLSAETVPDGAPAFKCCPPVRGRAEQDALWAALLDGTLACVVSDHSPSSPDVKHLDTGDLGAAWGGIASVQFGLAAVWTAARERGVDLDRVATWMTSGPADLVGLTAKGRIAAGADADLVVLAPDEQQQVGEDTVRHRHKLTPYLGRTLSGVVRRRWLHGVEVTETDVRGRLLRRG